MAQPAHELCPTCGQPQAAGRFGPVCLSCLIHLADEEEPDSAPASSGATEPSTRTFGDYDILEEIARGGMGVVYRARQRSLDREVALKLVLGAELADRETQRRLQREAQAAASLQHPHIVPVYEIGEIDQQPYFTMRLVPGGLCIADWAARERPGHRAIASAVALVARAVAHAHERGVLHRDLKPSNVLWDPQDGPQVTDFGLAKWLDDPKSSLSQSGHILGSPSYMAPEQAAGRHAEVTIASDVYGIGALLYELLTGEPPFQAANSLETLQRAQTEPPERPSKRVPTLDRDLETICLKCLEKNPADRYVTARALADELERFQRGESIYARPVSAPQQLWRWAQRNPRLAASLCGLMAAVLATTWQWRKAELAGRGERQAREEAMANVADLLVNRGFTSAREADPSRAALWFAQAAAATGDPARRSVNAIRWRAWRDDAPVAVRAFPAGMNRWSRLHWNPAQTALLVQHRARITGASVWDVASESRWAPGRPLVVAQWLPGSGNLAVVQDGHLLLLEYPSGRELRRQALPTGAVPLQLVVSADERWIGLGGREPLLWSPAEGRLLPLPQVPPRLPLSDATPDVGEGIWLEFSRTGGHLLLSGRGWRGVCLLDEPEKFIFPPLDSNLPGQEGFLAEGATFVIRSAAHELAVAETATGRLRQRVPLPPKSHEAELLLSASPSPDGRFLAGHESPLVEIATGRVQSIPVHKNVFFDLCFSRDGHSFATASVDDTVRLWQLAPGADAAQGQLIGWHQEAVAVALSPDERFIATGQSGGGLVRVWRLPRAAARLELPEGPSWMRVSTDGQFLVQGGWSGPVSHRRSTRVYRADTLEPAGPELEAGGLLLDSAFAPEASWLALATSSVTDRERAFAAGEAGAGQVAFWNFRTGERLGPPVALPFEPRALAVHPGGQKLGLFGAGRALAELERNGRVRVLQPPGSFTAETETWRPHCRYSPDGRTLAAWGRGHPPLLWNVETGQRVEVPQLAQETTWHVEFAGPTMAVSTSEGRVHLLRMPEGRVEAEPLRDTNWIFCVQFDAAGDRLLTGCRNRLARVWDWRAGRQVGPALVLDDEVYAGCFVPGSHVVTGARDGSIQFWDCGSGLELRSPLRLGGEVAQLQLVAGGRLAVNRPARSGRPPGGIIVLDLPALLAAPSLPVDEMVQLAELDAATIVRNALPEPLSAEDWLRRWREFRARRPGWHAW